MPLLQLVDGNKSSVFDDNVEKAVEALNRSLLAYFVLSTEPSGTSLLPLFRRRLSSLIFPAFLDSEGRSLRPVLLPVVLENGLTPKRTFTLPSACTFAPHYLRFFPVHVFRRCSYDHRRRCSALRCYGPAQPDDRGDPDHLDEARQPVVDVNG
jgi:hypothetical protein